VQHPHGKAHAARLRRDPHALDFRRPGIEQPDRAAADRVPVQTGEQESAPRAGELVAARRAAFCRVEAVREPRCHFGHIEVEAPICIGAVGVFLPDHHRSGGHQELDLGHGRDEPVLRSR
jgi:hypothetical protein